MTVAEFARTVKTTCPYCGVGCGILATTDESGKLTVSGDPDHPANFGRLCSKGMALADTVALDGRQLTPLVDGHETGWDHALDETTSRLRKVMDRHGPDAVALYGSGQMLSEDYYVANKLMKGFIGTANIDSNSRLCMASAVAGHVRAFGSDTVPGTYRDLELADLVVVVGANPAWCHPVLWQRVMQARESRLEMKLVIIDPRRTATAENADLFLPIISDGDVTLFTGLFRHLLRHGAVDNSFIDRHTCGLDEARSGATDWTIERVAERTGLKSGKIAAFYDLFMRTEKTVTFFSMGVNQSVLGTDKVNAIINCHLLTGRIGKPGMGPFSITGQPNAMGGREVGALANMLTAHMDFSDADRVAAFWNAPAIARKPGTKAVDLFRSLEENRIKAVWIIASNPVVSMPDADRAKQALSKCETVIVSDMFATTDTAHCAKIFLPAAGWGEKDGTVTNSERRISRQRAFLPLPGLARPDWWILAKVAQRLGFSDAFSYRNPAEIFAEYAALSALENGKNRDFNISGLKHADYDAMTPVQWPVADPHDIPDRPKRFFSDGRFYTPDGKAHFLAMTPPPRKWTKPGALVLNSGRIRDQWHTMTRTGRSTKLTGHYAEPFIEIHPRDAERLGIRRTQLVYLQNKRGKALLRALITQHQQPGYVFAPMHWSGQNTRKGRINVLTAADVDPVSSQPALKSSEVTLFPARMHFYGFCVSRNEPRQSATSYFATARCEGGWRTEFACTDGPIDAEVAITGILGAEIGADVLIYDDVARGIQAIACFCGEQLDYALYLSPDPVSVSRSWAVDLLTRSAFPESERFKVLAGRAGRDSPDKGQIVCACKSVGHNEIIHAIRNLGCASVEAIGDCLGAGTNCGSCRSEIRGIIRKATAVVAE